ncbi:MAG: 50S ribosomal protein L1 [Myxococcaceae bacterium]|nr:50S ribosomal protein L1 [Myxococcaceae bacterium]MBH2006500.1 50S ribosomal protein L1 [Myxococcaceae bacterium]
MAKHGKKYRNVSKKVDPQTRYGLEQACGLVKECKTAKFDESVDIAMNLGVDPRHADQNIRGAVILPHGTGKTVRVAVFAKGSKAKEAEEAGADVVGAEDLAARVESGFMDFDKVVASPDMMGVVGKLGKVLGPRGLMPNPKVGTVTLDVAKAVKEVKSGKIEFKVDKTGTLHAPLGRISFSASHLKDNMKSLLGAVLRAKPASLKGQYVRKVTLSSTMGPGVKVDLTEVMAIAD